MIDLHYADAEPDWQKVKPQDRNIWQRTAAATDCYVTPGNLVSLLGLALVIWGFVDFAEGNVLGGLIRIAAGRVMDLADGAVAHATGTKNSLGAALDAAIDKIELLIGLLVLTQHGLLPVLVGIAVGLQNTANILLAASAKKRQIELHPSRWGKIATAAQWCAIILYLSVGLSLGPYDESFSRLLIVLAHIVMILLFVPTGAVATYGYAKSVFGEHQAK